MHPEPSPTHFNIVVLQADFVPVPDFNLPPPYTCTKTVYPLTSLPELHERIHNATIIVFGMITMDAVTLSPEVTPYLKFIAVAGTGTDCIDLEACRKRGIVVSNCPSANVESVSEHALGMYFMTRRKMLHMHSLTRAGEWRPGNTPMYHVLDKDGQPPLSCQEEVVGIVGNGCVGQRIALLTRTLGMRVLISGRKDPNMPIESNGSNIVERVPFETVVNQSTVIFLAVPLTKTTRNLISSPEFESMSHSALLINVSRGGVVNEEALVDALKKGRIAGAATDVFREEPAGPGNSPLLGDGTKDLNLVVTPHLAWLAKRTKINQARLLNEVVNGWCTGRPCNVVT